MGATCSILALVNRAGEARLRCYRVSNWQEALLPFWKEHALLASSLQDKNLGTDSTLRTTSGCKSTTNVISNEFEQQSRGDFPFPIKRDV